MGKHLTGFYLIPLAVLAASCAPNGMSAANTAPSMVRIAQEQDALPQSCRFLGAIPVERRETLKRRVVALRANLVRYPLRNSELPIYRCNDADIEQFYAWNGG
jgi:hypothetical protein